MKLLLLLLLLANCSIKTEDLNPTIIKSTQQQQQQYEQEWMENVRHISFETAYRGYVDAWGGGPLNMHFWFQDGDLWDFMDDVDPDKNYVLHRLLPKSYPIRFVDGKTAIMEMVTSASPALSGSLYIVRIENGEIYRTSSPRGFEHIKRWDKKTVYLDNLMIMGTKDGNVLYLSTDMITGGHAIAYKKNNTSSTTLRWSANSSISDDPMDKQFTKIDFNNGTTSIYLNTDVPYQGNESIEYKVPHRNITYTMTIKDDKITEIQEESATLPNKGYLSTDMFINPKHTIKLTYYANNSSVTTKGTLLWNAEKDYIKDVSADLKEIRYGHILKSIYVDTSIPYDLSSSLIVSYKVPSQKIKYTLTFKNRRITSMHEEKILDPMPPLEQGKLNINMFKDGTEREITYYYKSDDTKTIIKANRAEIKNIEGTIVTLRYSYAAEKIKFNTEISYKVPNDNISYSIGSINYKLTIIDDKVTVIDIR